MFTYLFHKNLNANVSTTEFIIFSLLSFSGISCYRGFLSIFKNIL